jgi:hypothetical protein
MLAGRLSVMSVEGNYHHMIAHMSDDGHTLLLGEALPRRLAKRRC